MTNWGEFFIVREMGEALEQVAQHLRVAISHSSHAGINELRQAHAILQTLRKQYAALEQMLLQTPVGQPPALSSGDKVIGDVQAQLEALRTKIEQFEAAMPKKKRPRKKAP